MQVTPTLADTSDGVGLQSLGEIPHALRNTTIVPPPPMAEYAPYFDGPQPTAEEQAAVTDWYTQLQDSIASCMATRGFRYEPLPANSVGAGVIGRGGFLLVVPVPFLDEDRMVVEKNGYGVEGTPEQEAQASGLMDDPNETYRESLSPAEADAYSIALNGDYHVPTTEGSCSREAMDAFPKPTEYSDRGSVFLIEHGAVIQSATSVLGRGFFTDSRVMEMNQQWEGCMSSKGYVFDEASGSGTGPQAAMYLAMRTRPDGSVGPVPSPNTPSVSIPAQESSLLGTESERVVALVDYDCRMSMDYLDQLVAIRVQMDNDFIATNYDALQRLKNNE